MDYLHVEEEDFFASAIETRKQFGAFMKEFDVRYEPKIVEIITENNTETSVCWNGGGRSWNKFFNCNSEIELSNLEKISIISGNYDIFLFSNSRQSFLTQINNINDRITNLVKLLNSEENPQSRLYTFSVEYPKKIRLNVSGKTTRNDINTLPTKIRGQLFPLDNCALFPCANIAITTTPKPVTRHSEVRPIDFGEGKYVVYVECSYIENFNVAYFISNLTTNICLKTETVLPYRIPNMTGFLLFSEFIFVDRLIEKGGINVDLYRKIILDKIIKTSDNLPAQLFYMLENKLQFDIGAFLQQIGTEISSFKNVGLLKGLILVAIINYYTDLQPDTRSELQVFLERIFATELDTLEQAEIKNIFENRDQTVFLAKEVFRIYEENNIARVRKVAMDALFSYHTIFYGAKAGSEKNDAGVYTKKSAFNKAVASALVAKFFPDNTDDEFIKVLIEKTRPYINASIALINSELKTRHLSPDEAFIMVVGGDAMRRYDPEITDTYDIDAKLIYKKPHFKVVSEIVADQLIKFSVLLSAIITGMFSNIPFRRELVFEYTDYSGRTFPVKITSEMSFVIHPLMQYRTRHIKKSTTFPIDLYSIDYRTHVLYSVETIDPTIWSKFTTTRHFNVNILDISMIEQRRISDIKEYIHKADDPVPVASLGFLINDLESTYRDESLSGMRISRRKQLKDRKRLAKLKSIFENGFEYDKANLNNLVMDYYHQYIGDARVTQAVEYLKDIFNKQEIDKTVRKAKIKFGTLQLIT